MTPREYAAQHGISVPAVMKRIRTGAVKAVQVEGKWQIEDGASGASADGAKPQTMDDLKKEKLKLDIERVRLDMEANRTEIQVEGYRQAISDMAEVFSKVKMKLSALKLEKPILDKISCSIAESIAELGDKS